MTGSSIGRSCEAAQPYPPDDLASFELAPGVAEACATLRGAGFLLIVVTNQPDIARGTRSREDVEALNRRLSELVPVDEIRVCPHDDRDRCECRKPSPGLLLAAAKRARHRPAAQRHGRRPLAGHRDRRASGVLDRFRGSRVLRAPAREARPHGSVARRGGAMDTGDHVQGKDQGMTASASSLKVKIFADGADRKAILISTRIR